jgi:V-type H+-transporting ATPase subunit a
MASDDYPSLFRKLVNSQACYIVLKRRTGSEEMSFVQFIIPLEVAHDTIAELGQLGNVQFKDVSQLMQLNWWVSEPYDNS